MPDRLLEAVLAGTRVYDLTRPMEAGMPQSPNHPEYRHVLQRRHGDVVRTDGGSAASDLFILGGHVGTHIDALSHVSQDGRLHGGEDAETAQAGGHMRVHDVASVAPGLFRGVLLDVPAALGVDALEPAYEVTAEDLERTAREQLTAVAPGDAVLVRTGWARRWHDGAAYVGHDSGVPGVGEAGARWLAARSPKVCGGDSIAFERLAPGAGHALLPAHRVLIVEAGITIIETLDLEELAADNVHEFTFVLTPLRLVGATGSPLRPLAVVSRG